MSAPHVLHFTILFPISAPLQFDAHIRAIKIIAHIWAIVNIEATPYDQLYILSVVIVLICFDRLWETLKEKNISQYKLIKEYHISTGQLDRLRKNGTVSTYTLTQLCTILQCRLNDIAEFIPDETP